MAVERQSSGSFRTSLACQRDLTKVNEFVIANHLFALRPSHLCQMAVLLPCGFRWPILVNTYR